jgi:large subunit ribosomal protein L4
LIEKLKAMALDNVLIVDNVIEDNLFLSARNLPHVDVVQANRVDPVSLVRFEKVIVTTAAVTALEEMLA